MADVSSDKRRDEILKRMLQTPPQPKGSKPKKQKLDFPKPLKKGRPKRNDVD
jgi:hypothetical protein